MRKKKIKKKKRMEQTKKGVWVDKKGEKERKMEEGKNSGGNKQERERKKKVFRFSLRSTNIGSWIFVGVRGKVGPRNEGYAWVPKSRGFIKLQEVKNFPTCIIF